MALRWTSLVWAALVLWNYLPGHPALGNSDWLAKSLLPPCPPWDAPFIMERLRSLAASATVAALFMMGAHAAGMGLARWIRLRDSAMPVTLLLGWGISSMFWLGAGLGAVWFTPVAWMVLITGGIAGGRALPRWIAGLRRQSGWWMALALPAACVTLAGALAPETELDAVRYHLGLPATFIAHHRVFVPERMMFASFPLNASMAFGSVMLAAGQPAAKLLNWSLLWIIAAMIHRLAGGGIAGRVGALLWLCVPVVLVHAAMGFAELTTTAFLTAALIRINESRSHAHRIGSAILAGFAFGTSYRAAHGVIPLAVLSWILAPRRFRGLSFFPISLLPMLPWLCKNWLIVGNPVHPIAARLMGSLEDESVALSRSVVRLTEMIPADVPVFGGSWHLLVQADRSASYPFGPAAMVILPLIVVGISGRAERLSVFALLFTAVWLATTPGWGRYLIGALPAGCAAAAIVIAGTLATRALLRPAGIFLIVILWAGSALLGATTIFARHFPLPHACGCESTTEYLASRIAPAPHAAAILKAAGNAVPNGDRIYLWGMVTSAFSGRESHADYEHSTPIFQMIVNVSATPDDVARKFRQRKFRAFVHDLAGGVSQSTSANLLPWTPRMIPVWQGFVRQSLTLTELIERESDNVYLHLYTVRRSPDPSARLPRGDAWPHLPGMERMLVPGDIAYDAKDLRRALSLYESTSKEYPGYAWVWQRIAVVARELKNAPLKNSSEARLRKLAGWGRLHK